MAEQAATATADIQAEAKTRGSLMGKLMIVGFMGVVVGVECLLAYILIPSAEEVAKIAKPKILGELPDDLVGSAEGESPEEASKAIEVDLERYSITVAQPNSNTSLRVDFHLFGTIRESEQADFDKVFARKKNRFRYQVISEIRNSERDDLADPELGLIRRRILANSTDLFGQPLLRSVIFAEFSHIEQ